MIPDSAWSGPRYPIRVCLVRFAREEFGLAVLLGLRETLKFVDLLVFWIFHIPAIWVICKIAEFSDDNASIVFRTIFIVATVFMAAGEFLQDG